MQCMVQCMMLNFGNAISKIEQLRSYKSTAKFDAAGNPGVINIKTKRIRRKASTEVLLLA